MQPKFKKNSKSSEDSVWQRNVTLLAVILLVVINLKRYLIQTQRYPTHQYCRPFGVIGSSPRISTFHFCHSPAVVQKLVPIRVVTTRKHQLHP